MNLLNKSAMHPLAKVLLYGLWISLVGTLPLGTLNITSMQISLQETYLQAIYFILGILLVEIIYVRITLLGIEKTINNQKLKTILKTISIIIMLLMTYSCFKIASENTAIPKNAFLNINIHRFLLGAFMSAVNPFQFPFWIGWSAILFEKKVLIKSNSYYNFYIIGIGIGTLLGNLLFVLLGHFIKDSYVTFNRSINFGLGIFYLISIYLLLRKKTS
jgi:threonine/homoserine/homoserine lactone efflux protein